MNNQLLQTNYIENSFAVEQTQSSLKTTISAVVRVRNTADQLNCCLSRLKTQNMPKGTELEVIIVDNDSSDNSRQIAAMHGAIITSISTENFSWGRSLNLGISKASGQHILILSSDAYPFDDNFINEMLEPLANKEIAAVYGRQIPYANVPIDELVRLERYFPCENKVFDKNSKGISPTGKGIIASNACALIRKSIWQQLEFDEQVEGGEDGIWAYQVLQAGYAIAYQAQAKVYHSHKDSAFKLAWRECELLKKNTIFSGKNFNLRKILRYLVSFSKRRLKNCLRTNVPVLLKIKGLVRLPWEIAAITLIGFCMTCAGRTHKARWLFWQ
jgi:rhamnosyltransferase